MIIMFKPSDSGLPRYEFFLNAFNRFKGNFVVPSLAEDEEWILRTFNTVEKDFYWMEDEARKVMSDPKSAKIIRKTYNRKDFWKAVTAAEDAGILLSVPDDLC